jgi:hypothetical protein
MAVAERLDHSGTRASTFRPIVLGAGGDRCGGCEQALVVANRQFTQQARRLARPNKVEFWDREVLISKLVAVRGKRAEAPVAPVTEVVAANDTASTGRSVSVLPEPALQVANAAAATGVNASRCARCGTAVSEKGARLLPRPARALRRAGLLRGRARSGS